MIKFIPELLLFLLAVVLGQQSIVHGTSIASDAVGAGAGLMKSMLPNMASPFGSIGGPMMNAAFSPTSSMGQAKSGFNFGFGFGLGAQNGATGLAAGQVAAGQAAGLAAGQAAMNNLELGTGGLQGPGIALGGSLMAAGAEQAAAIGAASGLEAANYNNVGNSARAIGEMSALGGVGMANSAANVASAASAAAAAAGAAGASAVNSIGASNLIASAPSVALASPAIAATGAALAQNAPISHAIANQASGRQSLAMDAYGNAHAEAAIAGNDMVAHGLNNARSSSLASNAYRQAKLASARDRVNIAGTIQNAARISDAAIATHDAATKAEDSLLGSELSVDSASTVLDSDAAYIPPVTNSLLRSLPYGRLGLRNIIPKPLTYPSVLLPDVWLNGLPVNYINAPLRMLPYGIGANGYGYGYIDQSGATGAAFAAGGYAGGISGQPFLSNNGIPINGMVMDPAVAFLSSRLNGITGSSILPVLAYGQLEAQDEIAMANLLTMQQQAGAGMATTYQGYGRMNPVPMLTGTVSDVNLAPTTTIGTTYPVGSALVVEPRDSYFQDYIDNASSRQNFDEHQQ